MFTLNAYSYNKDMNGARPDTYYYENGKHMKSIKLKAAKVHGIDDIARLESLNALNHNCEIKPLDFNLKIEPSEEDVFEI